MGDPSCTPQHPSQSASRSPLPSAAGSPALPRDFRKLPIEARREILHEALSLPLEAQDDLAWCDAMVESAVGHTAVPLGVATGFLIDSRRFAIPMAVEEPSVVAAATFAGTLIAAAGGIQTWASEPEMVSQVFLEGVSRDRERSLLEYKREIGEELAPLLTKMGVRGGGYRGLEVSRLESLDIVRVDLIIDVRDAMGANIINTAAERVRPVLERVSGGTALMCILTNESTRRRAGASFSLPLSRLRRGRFDGAEAGRRIALASRVAQVDPSRAVTHNKGVMNGVSALALATGNDTRGIEAAVHRWAARTGHYRGVAEFRVEEKTLAGEIELPLPFASVGGSVGFHPSTRAALALLGNPDAQSLARIGVAVGLAQNFAAIYALVTEGIQKGHMKLHAARTALLAGARGSEVRRVAEHLARIGSYTLEAAREKLEQLRAEPQ